MWSSVRKYTPVPLDPPHLRQSCVKAFAGRHRVFDPKVGLRSLIKGENGP
jgi:hypothetical protein